VSTTGGLTGLKLISEKSSQHGCRVELDADPSTPGVQPFPAGAVLEFNMCALTSATSTNCDFIWSSDPSKNSDSFDHLQITPLHSADFPGRIFQLNWEDLPNGGDMDFNDLIAVVRVDMDSDGDGLWDDWEKFGIDVDGDGVVDLNLPALGANPMHKDIFLEIDYMDCAVAGGDCAAGDTHSHRPKTAAIAAVVQAFANAPVMNPDGTTGINIHIDVSNAIAHQNALNINGLCFAGGAGIGSFDAVKADPANFGPNNPRRFAYHYVLFTHQQTSTTTSSGCAELPGNDFQVALGGWNVGAGDIDGDGLPDANVGTIQQQAGTLMHELGHNLNLQHGGGDSVNFKPNYLSIMSYRFQVVGIPPTDPDGSGPLTARIDYSRAQLAALNENSLNEPAGIGDGTDNTRYNCPGGSVRTGAGTGPIDWNCNNVATDVGTAVDISGDTTFTTLQGFDDWRNIKYDFQGTGSFEDGDHAESLQTEEIDYPTHLQMSACPTGQGFWKTHLIAWPVPSLTLGSQSYSKPELLALLQQPTRGDASLILAYQLIAAQLNIANSSDPTPVADAIRNADNLLGSFSGKLPYNVGTNSAPGRAMTQNASVLESYNSSILTPECQP